MARSRERPTAVPVQANRQKPPSDHQRGAFDASCIARDCDSFGFVQIEDGIEDKDETRLARPLNRG